MMLVTGSNGFVGKALCNTLRAGGAKVRAAVRKGATDGEVNVGDLNGKTDWCAAVAGCEVVFHLAARVHVMSDTDEDPLRAYREVNLDGTLNLARQAVAAGVRRFVFVSSVKVNGEATTTQPFRASDVPQPCDPYGVSKMEAEQALLQLGRDTGLEVVIVRPPLVYGPGVKANFLNLIKLVQKGVPLPFGSIRNLRSMVALDNLVDLLIVCSQHPAAPGHVFMVSDGDDMGVKELVTKIGRAMHKRVLLVPVPVVLMAGAAKLLGKQGVVDRLAGSLQVDIASTQSTLGWRPVVTPQAAIDKTVEQFLLKNSQSKK
ncbi:UDP-glucose 4-epimerase family protein [Janthinobacterium aquaticum]|uniref:UDP-glucose 4-epimerase family protein n=1 Tax=Janthinobacterium sp. FT58W TaxID=2654254 RepID=UPI0012649C61|nr:SDR family oxidoreductase [Janthinobacterium sp. FT58W]KAB8043991.1 NAD-dependent epimerase/dehydratase family protein [Janthinobacterium sp. FT58W]